MTKHAWEGDSGNDVVSGRSLWWWCVPLAVTVVGLPVLVGVDVYIVADLWFGSCEHDDNACDGPYTTEGELRAMAVSMLLPVTQTASTAVVWAAAGSLSPKARGWQRCAYGVMAGATVIAGVIAWLW
ncbi:hypothetical protein OG216_47095 (plasmid) [Streptomycetaceae bacterium NBC_01309]